jgi:ABC-type lipoprotein export system ATPase subunit
MFLDAAAVKKEYRIGSQTLDILRGVDFSINEGELAVIVGPSGSGKSTLLHALGGLDRPSLGEIRFEGKNLYQLREKEIAQLRNQAFGFVFQFYHLIPELTALENSVLPARIAGSLSGVELRNRAMELLEQVGLADRASHLPSELSGGEQQRIAIARALINRPRVLFCDEPTGNLDSATGKSILELLLEEHRQRKTALVIVTHDASVTKLAKKVYSLRDGALHAS